MELFSFHSHRTLISSQKITHWSTHKYIFRHPQSRPVTQESDHSTQLFWSPIYQLKKNSSVFHTVWPDDFNKLLRHH